MSNFADVIENIKKLDYKELQELNFLLQNILVILKEQNC